MLGRFALLAVRAFGATSTAFEALDVERGDRCVVKVVRADGDAMEARRRAEREAALHALAPVEVVPALRACGLEEIPAADPALEPVVLACLAIDEAPGVPLIEAAASGAAVSALSRALLAALDALHKAGLAHGDLTPAHAFASPAGTVTLIDLGSSGRLGDPPDRGDAATPAFAAPERMTGPSVAADLYSWGRVVVRLGLPRTDRQLAAAVRYATSPDPARRPATAAELLRALPGL